MYTLKVLLSEVESLQVQVSGNEAQRTLEAKVEQLGEKMDILLRSLNRGSPSVVSLNDAVTAAAAAPEVERDGHSLLEARHVACMHACMHACMCIRKAFMQPWHALQAHIRKAFIPPWHAL